MTVPGLPPIKPAAQAAAVPSDTTGPPPRERSRAIRRVLWVVLVVNLSITAVKLSLGFATGALAVIADGFHSIVDASSNVIGLVGIWIASRPPDRDHPYGHRKYETVAALAIGALLLLASWEIVQGVLARLFSGRSPDVDLLDIVLVALTFPANLLVVVYEGRRARALGSDLLAADAAHTRTDLFVTLSVVASLVAVHLGWGWLDLVVAGGVVVLIVVTAIGILRTTSDVLADSAVLNPQQVIAIVRTLPGVWYAHRVRSRGRPDAIHVDLHVKVDPAMSTQQSHAIASEVERQLKDQLSGVVDAVVHIEPGAGEAPSEWESVAVSVRAEADGMGLGVHDLHVHAEPGGRYSLEMHVEVAADLSLGAAHRVVDELENRVRAAVPEVTSVTSHIEPLPSEVPGELGAPAGGAELARRVRLVADEVVGVGAAHDIQIHRVAERLTVTVHLTLPADQTLAEAHALADEVERRVLSELPVVQRVVVHVEPPEPR